MASSKQEQKSKDSSCAEACLLTSSHNCICKNCLPLLAESKAAAILRDHQALTAVWSILLPEAICLILYQVTAVLLLALFLSKVYL